MDIKSIKKNSQRSFNNSGKKNDVFTFKINPNRYSNLKLFQNLLKKILEYDNIEQHRDNKFRLICGCKTVYFYKHKTPQKTKYLLKVIDEEDNCEEILLDTLLYSSLKRQFIDSNGLKKIIFEFIDLHFIYRQIALNDRTKQKIQQLMNQSTYLKHIQNKLKIKNNNNQIEIDSFYFLISKNNDIQENTFTSLIIITKTGLILGQDTLFNQLSQQEINQYFKPLREQYILENSNFLNKNKNRVLEECEQSEIKQTRSKKENDQSFKESQQSILRLLTSSVDSGQQQKEQQIQQQQKDQFLQQQQKEQLIQQQYKEQLIQQQQKQQYMQQQLKEKQLQLQQKSQQLQQYPSQQQLQLQELNNIKFNQQEKTVQKHIARIQDFLNTSIGSLDQDSINQTLDEPEQLKKLIEDLKFSTNDNSQFQQISNKIEQKLEKSAINKIGSNNSSINSVLTDSQISQEQEQYYQSILGQSEIKDKYY